MKRSTNTLVVFAMLHGLASSLAHADEEEACTEEASAEARRHVALAEAHEVEERYTVAADGYRAAFDVCPLPFLLFNAAQMFWLAEREDDALALYRRFLALEPGGQGASVARRRFFEAANARFDRGEGEESARLYEEYLSHVSRGARAAKARERLELIERERRERAASMEARAASAEASAEIRAAERERVARAERERERRQARAARAGATWLRWQNMSSAPRIFIAGGAGTLALGLVFHVWGAKADSGDLQDLAFVSYVTGGMMIGTGILWAYSERERASTSPVVVPAVDSSSVGVRVFMRF